MLKRLAEFRQFDWERFADGKTFVTSGVRPWFEFRDGHRTDNRLGTSVEVVILHDHTKYRDRDGEQVTNRFEKLVFKVPQVIDIPVDAQVVPVDVVATVYGEFQNQLAVKCARIDEVKKPAAS